MALVQNRRLFPISEIVEGIGLWTVKVQVVERHRTQFSSTSGSNISKRYRRYLLVDEHGNKVSGVVYDNDVDYFETSLQPFRRYLISNARLNQAYAYFIVGPYEFTWVITNDTPVELIDEPVVPPLPFTYTVCPFNEFVNHADKEVGFNVKAIAVHAMPRRQVKRDVSHREFVVIDESKLPVIMTLWNSYGDDEGSIIAKNITNAPLIIGVNMRATTFHGLSIASRTYSCILVDPPLNENHSLREWYNKNKAEISKLIANEVYRDTDLLLPPPALTQTMDVPTAAATLLMNNSAWVVGKIRFVATEQAYYVVACQNCHKKAVAGTDWFLRCSSCGEHKKVQLRCRVPVELTGGNKSLPVVLTTPDVERLTRITPQQLKDSHEFGFHVEDDLQIALDKLEVICFVKKYDRNNLGSPGRHGIRYSVAKTYPINAVQSPPALTAPSSSAVNLASSSSTMKQGPSEEDKQLFTPSTKKELEAIDNSIEVKKTEQPASSAKRPLDFISSPPETQPSHDTALSSPKTTVAPCTDEVPPSAGSPIKKGRDKMKLN